ncbi:hypothetical protein FGO68_gene7548 [Halteria grandinella]|uniref:Uncharacterized protein n=1 Tax=Halteria grandinella TaxID=5974 RepID=A0A8J8T7P0_HALGN|nr:hypothetical protein FGO68_gene7548 [Halteria grandinella]
MKQLSTSNKQSTKRSGEVQGSKKHCRPRQKAPKQLLKKEEQGKKNSEVGQGISKILRKSITKSAKGKFPPRDEYCLTNRSNHPDTRKHQAQVAKLFKCLNKEEEKQAADNQTISNLSTQASTEQVPPRSIKSETPFSHQTGQEGVKVELLISTVLIAFMARLKGKFTQMLDNEGITHNHMKYKWEDYESLRQRQTKLHPHNWMDLVKRFANKCLNIETSLLEDRLLAILLFKKHGAKIANEPRAIEMRQELDQQEQAEKADRRRQKKSGQKEQAIKAKQERKKVKETIVGKNLNFKNLGDSDKKRYENLRVFYEVFAPRKNQSNFKLFLQHAFIQRIWIKLFDPANSTPEDFFKRCQTQKPIQPKKSKTPKKPIPAAIYVKGFKKFAKWMGPARLFPVGFMEYIEKGIFV